VLQIAILDFHLRPPLRLPPALALDSEVTSQLLTHQIGPRINSHRRPGFWTKSPRNGGEPLGGDIQTKPPVNRLYTPVRVCQEQCPQFSHPDLNAKTGDNITRAEGHARLSLTVPDSRLSEGPPPFRQLEALVTAARWREGGLTKPR
jgi:hypothetical protein